MKDFLKDSGNLISFSLALIPSILLYVFQPTDSVPYAIFVISVMLSVLFLWIAIKCRLDLKVANANPQFKVRTVCDSIIICEPKGILMPNSLLTIYWRENELEKFMTYGYVQTINDHGFAQVELIEPSSDVLNKINNCDYSRLIVKPTITSDILSDLYSNVKEVSI